MLIRQLRRASLLLCTVCLTVCGTSPLRERKNIMMKSILVTVTAIAGISFTADSALAGRRCCRTHRPARCCATTCCNATPCCNATTAPAENYAPETAPATAQANGTNGYQSFSYEPGAAGTGTTVMVAPIPVQQRSSSFYDQVRGDRKARGIY